MKKKLVKYMLIFIFKTDSHARENFHAEERHGGARLPKAIVEKKDLGILIFAYFGHFLIHKNIF